MLKERECVAEGLQLSLVAQNTGFSTGKNALKKMDAIIRNHC